MLSNLTLANNNLSGSLPLSWGTNSQLIPRFKNLQWLTLLPGAMHQVAPMVPMMPMIRAIQSLC